ncbi:hypothetical protein F5X96DRAFT_641970 [Biscogniauxia mediterranea]|nr:hypothetical protein F5X96DRAFT_641970 [Biscogniauxia mediterranea]
MLFYLHLIPVSSPLVVLPAVPFTAGSAVLLIRIACLLLLNHRAIRGETLKRKTGVYTLSEKYPIIQTIQTYAYIHVVYRDR